MQGRLTDQPLAELIREITSKGLSGTLRIEHERAQAAVYFEDSAVVFAASNIRTLRLREYLFKRNLISEAQVAGLGNIASDLGLAATLSAKGLVKPEDINAAMAAMVSDTLRVTLLWTEGSWNFNERARLGDPIRIKIDTNKLLREAAQRLPLKFVALRFRNPGELISRSEDASEPGSFHPNESFILSRLDTPTNIEQLIVMSGLRDLDAYRILYGLTLSGLAKRQYWHNAFRTSEAVKPQLAQPSSTPAAPASEAADKRWGSGSEEDNLKPFFDRLAHATNHYQILDLPLAANATEIKEAYYGLARRYHPDRFHLKSGSQVHLQISSAFARITQAYETLINPQSRSTYDGSLKRSQNFAASAPKRTDDYPTTASPEDLEFDIGSPETGNAEHCFQEGFGALKQGQINAAVAHLAAASRLMPDEARYRAYYGRALAASEKTRRLAEQEIQAAVTLDPRNASYRTMLAELYFDLRFHRRAQTELDRALAIEPNNASAQALSRKLASLGEGRT